MYRAYKGPSGGWYVAVEHQATGRPYHRYHHRPADGGTLSEHEARTLAVARNKEFLSWISTPVAADD